MKNDNTGNTTLQIIVFIIACLVFCFRDNVWGQKWYSLTKKDVAAYSLYAGSGIAYGYNQAIVHHHFGQGNKFWDKDISWQNKFKNYPIDKSAAFIGSKTIFVPFTDGQHLTQMLSTTFLIGGTGLLVWDCKSELAALPKKDRWKYVLFKKVLMPLLIRSLAFEITFNNL